MKGTIKKIIKPSSSVIRGGGEEALGKIVWEVEYQELLPHAGVSKKGTGPGVNKKVYTTKSIPLHPQDICNAEDGKEINFEIDNMTPLGMARGQEEYSGIMQPLYGIGAKITHEINKIEYGEHCFGPYVRVDGESLFVEERDSDLEKKVYESKILLFKELEMLLPELDMMDWKSIAQIVAGRGKWEWVEEESHSDSCDQCGNWNTGETYIKPNLKENI